MATNRRPNDGPRIPRSKSLQAGRIGAGESTSPTVAGVRISHPDRVIYPDLGISKIQLVRYYEGIADWIMPHVIGRPLTLLHCPAGLNAPCNYLKHAKAWGPSALRRVQIQEKTKVGEYLVADSIEAVVSLAQMGIVEIHTWNSTAKDIEHPNRLVWDLDPGPKVSWAQVVAAARLVRSVLKTLGLRRGSRPPAAAACTSLFLSNRSKGSQRVSSSRAPSATRSRKRIRGPIRRNLQRRAVRIRFSSTTSETTEPIRRSARFRHARAIQRRCRCQSTGRTWTTPPNVGHS
jgi:hypothetical protein